MDIVGSVNSFDFINNPYPKFTPTEPFVIEFFQTWCPPCHQSLPLIEEFSHTIKVVSVSTEPYAELKDFFLHRPTMKAYAVAVDESRFLKRLVKQYQITIPIIFVVHENRIIYKGNPNLEITHTAISVALGKMKFDVDDKFLQLCQRQKKSMVMSYLLGDEKSEENLPVFLLLQDKFNNQIEFILISNDRKSILEKQIELVLEKLPNVERNFELVVDDAGFVIENNLVHTPNYFYLTNDSQIAYQGSELSKEAFKCFSLHPGL